MSVCVSTHHAMHTSRGCQGSGAPLAAHAPTVGQKCLCPLSLSFSSPCVQVLKRAVRTQAAALAEARAEQERTVAELHRVMEHAARTETQNYQLRLHLTLACGGAGGGQVF